MELRDIIVLVDSSDSGISRLTLAIELARRADARLTGVGVIPLPNAPSPIPLVEPLGFVEAAAEGHLQPASFEGVPLIELDERRFRSASEGLRAEWLAVDHGHPGQLIQLGRLADLVILGQAPPDQHGGLWGIHPEDVVVEAGGPCLVVPYAGSFSSIAKHVIVAWDGSKEAARALRDSKPLLREADDVTIIGVSNPTHTAREDGLSIDRVVAHLAAQGIAARAESDIRGDLKISDVLLDRAADLGADLLVSGSFHHSRIRESVLGGFSREILDHMTVPVLMSH